MDKQKSQPNTSTKDTWIEDLEKFFTSLGIRYESPEESEKDWERIFKEDREKRQKAKTGK